MATATTAVMLPETFKPEVFKGLIDKAPDIYINSKTRTEKALEVGNKLLTTIEAEIKTNGRISDELDVRLNNYLVNVRTATKEINEQRSPITTMFTAISKLYTGLEGLIDVTKPETTPAKIQKFRNELAALKAKEAAEAEKERLLKLEIEKEKINLKSAMITDLHRHFGLCVETYKKNILTAFESAKLETIDLVKSNTANLEATYPISHFEMWTFAVSIVFYPHSIKYDVKELEREVKEGLYNHLNETFKTDIDLFKASYLDKIPSKKAELEAIAKQEAERLAAEKTANEAKEAAAKADAANKVRLEAEAAEAEKKRLEAEAETKRMADEAAARETAENKKIAEQKAKQKSEAAAIAETNKAVMMANTLFDSESTINQNTQTAQVREGYEIIVNSPLGYMAIAAFYFEREGKTETVEKLEKKTLGQMKTFCETLAKKTDEKITSPFLTYIETFKAVAKKA